ncbi:MAG TPA: DUF3363 domain-containing protein [Alphaproteobacteria bacterium]|nr:DUF3363 domain-containing protein [Alphaproteobacteria bacterium]
MTFDHEFRPKLGRIRTRSLGTKRAKGFVARVLRAAENGVGLALPKQSTTNLSTFGRGRLASLSAQRLLSNRARRVVVKARVVRQGPKTAPLTTHLSYLKRDGVTKDGAAARMFNADTDDADANDFADRTKGDRHHFRFTVSPEEAAEMGDLKAFTRDLMDQMERDLGTKLEWVAVDHWNTDNPHIHIAVRGKADQGDDLVISRDYISRGFRARASELVTIELGPQTELDMLRKLSRETDVDRWTRLDQALRRATDAETMIIDLRPGPRDGPDGTIRRLMVGRLQKLEQMGLANPVGPSRWTIAEHAESTLRDLGIRGDIVKTMHRALSGERSAAEFAIHDSLRAPLIGKVVDKGLHDELAGTGYLIADGVDGRPHYVRLANLIELEDVTTGSVVMLGPPQARPSDRTIAELASQRAGIYGPDDHLRALVRGSGGNADAVVEAHVRRLEALRRASIVQRLEDGRWEVPPDYLDRARAYDLKRGAASEIEIQMLSTLPVERQISAAGATWLDRELVSRDKTDFANSGFGLEVRDALTRRGDYLIEAGLARRQSQQLIFVRNLLDTLTRRELETVGSGIATETGLEHLAVEAGDRIRGVYRRRVDLVSGRFALVDDGRQFVLVPWRPIVERNLGREVTGIVGTGGVSWDLSRQRGLSI